MTIPTSPDDPAWNDPIYPDRKPPEKQNGWAGLGIVALIGLLVWGCVALMGDDDTTSGGGDDTETDRYTAIAACENSVEAQLRAPATAEFSGEVATITTGRNYRVEGSVDAENGFGALIRTSWTCTATPTPEGYRGTAILVDR